MSGSTSWQYTNRSPGGCRTPAASVGFNTRVATFVYASVGAAAGVVISVLGGMGVYTFVLPDDVFPMGTFAILGSVLGLIGGARLGSTLADRRSVPWTLTVSEDRFQWVDHHRDGDLVHLITFDTIHSASFEVIDGRVNGVTVNRTFELTLKLTDGKLFRRSLTLPLRSSHPDRSALVALAKNLPRCVTATDLGGEEWQSI